MTSKIHFNVYDVFVHCILTDMYQPLLRPSSGCCYYYKNTNERLLLAVSPSLHKHLVTEIFSSTYSYKLISKLNNF
jgi:hypothetical protein